MRHQRNNRLLLPTTSHLPLPVSPAFSLPTSPRYLVRDSSPWCAKNIQSRVAITRDGEAKALSLTLPAEVPEIEESQHTEPRAQEGAEANEDSPTFVRGDTPDVDELPSQRLCAICHRSCDCTLG